MLTTKRESFTSLPTLRRELDRLFDNFFGEMPITFTDKPLGIWDPYMGQPSVEMYESNGDVVVRAEIPGINKKDLEVDVTEESLILKGEIKKETEEKKKNYYMKEMHYGSFFRNVPFPTPVRPEKARAELKDGILEVHVPKSEKVQPKELKVDVK